MHFAKRSQIDCEMRRHAGASSLGLSLVVKKKKPFERGLKSERFEEGHEGDFVTDLNINLACNR